MTKLARNGVDCDDDSALRRRLAALAKREDDVATQRRRLKKIKRDVGMRVEDSGAFPTVIIRIEPDPFPSIIDNKERDR